MEDGTRESQRTKILEETGTRVETENKQTQKGAQTESGSCDPGGNSLFLPAGLPVCF